MFFNIILGVVFIMPIWIHGMELSTINADNHDAIEKIFAPINNLMKVYNKKYNEGAYHQLPAIRALMYVRTFESPLLFPYITRNPMCVNFNLDMPDNPLIIPPAERKFYQFDDLRMPYKSGGIYGAPTGFYRTTSSAGLPYIKDMFYRKSKNIPENVYVEWIETPVDTNKTAELLHSLSKKYINIINQQLYVITPQSRNGHSNLVISRVCYNQETVCFLIDSRGQRIARITYLNKAIEKNGKIKKYPHKILIDASDESPALQDTFLNQDLNCALYTLHYGIAAIHFFSTKKDRIFYSFENECQKNDYQKAGIALHNGLKQYLPEYFIKENDEVFVQRSHKETMYSHCIGRWKIDSLSLENLKKSYEALKLRTNGHHFDYIKTSFKRPNPICFLPVLIPGQLKLLHDRTEGQHELNHSKIYEKPINKDGRSKRIIKKMSSSSKF